MGERRVIYSILDRYFLRRFVFTYFANLISFTGLYVLIDSVNNLDRFLETTDGFAELFRAMAVAYSALIPPLFCQVLGPVVAATAAMFTVTTVYRAGEFTPILAAGRSYQRTLMPLLAASLAVSLLVFLVQELWIPRTGRALRDAGSHRKGSRVYRDVKHYDTTRDSLISFLAYDTAKREATGVLVAPFGDGVQGGTDLINAKFAHWDDDGEEWWLIDGTLQKYRGRRLVVRDVGDSPDVGEARLLERFDRMRLKTDLMPEEIENSREDTVSLPLGVLRRKADPARSLDHRKWRVKYLTRFFDPLANFVLVLLGLPIVVYFGSRNLFVGALLAVAMCAGYFGLNETFKDLGVRGILPARVGAVLAPAFFTAIGLTAFRGMRS